ncbi:MAG TPA: hypothetical protein IAC19_10980 [Candidatus Ventricola gallistercoris]|nr:hypothetical protein [Candidatus Ventricola gallistercoris]
MSKCLKVLAIAALLCTVAGACAVLYGINTLKPQVEQAFATVTPAVQVQDVFDGVLDQLETQTFAGKVWGNTDALQAQNCVFLTYTVRLNNRGFFPAEWISLEVTPQEDTDLLMLADTSAHVLTAGSRGDLTATILTTDSGNTERTLTVTCYVFGQKIEFEVAAA